MGIKLKTLNKIMILFSEMLSVLTQVITHPGTRRTSVRILLNNLPTYGVNRECSGGGGYTSEYLQVKKGPSGGLDALRSSPKGVKSTQ